MDEATLETFLERLEPLAEKLGQGAEFLWEVSLRQVYLSSVGWFIFAAVLIAIGWAIRRAALTEGAKWQTLEDEMVAKAVSAAQRNRGYPGLGRDDVKKALDDWRFPWRPISIMGTITAAVGLVPLWTGVTRLLNPGYFAVEKMLNTVGL